MGTADLLTIALAAAALNLSSPRVHQLLAEGLLDGVALPSGRNRHVPGAPRVTVASVERLRRERDEAAKVHGAARAAARGGRGHAPAAETAPSTAGGSDLDVEAARSAALELKVRLDTAREQIRRERDRADRLLEVASTLIDLLREASTSADGFDEVAEGYSQALTQLLAPGKPPAE